MITDDNAMGKQIKVTSAFQLPIVTDVTLDGLTNGRENAELGPIEPTEVDRKPDGTDSKTARTDFVDGGCGFAFRDSLSCGSMITGQWVSRLFRNRRFDQKIQNENKIIAE